MMTPNDLLRVRCLSAAWLACAVVILLLADAPRAEAWDDSAPPRAQEPAPAPPASAPHRWATHTGHAAGVLAPPRLPRLDPVLGGPPPDGVGAQPALQAQAPLRAPDRSPADTDPTTGKPPQPQVLRFDSDSAAKLAVLQSPTVITAATDVMAKAANLEAARLIWRPTLSFLNLTSYGRGDSTSFQAVQRVDEPGVPSGFAEGGYMANTLSLTLPLYYNGTLFSRDTPLAVQAEGSHAVSQETLKLQQVEAANLVVKAYFNAVLATEQLRLYQAQYASHLTALEIVRQRVAARQTRLEDQLSIETAIAAALAGVNTAASLYQTKSVEFRSLLGLADSGNLELADVADAVPPLPTLNQVVEKAINDHPKVKAQEAAVQVARGALMQVKGTYGPSLTFTTTFTEANNMEQFGTRPNFFTSGVWLTVPIADFGQSDAKIRSKQHALTQSEQQLQVVRSTLVQDMAAAYHGLSAAKAQIPAAMAKLELLRHAEQVTKANYDLGKVALDRLIADQNNVLTQQIVLLGSKYAAWGAYADLIAVAGKPYSSQVMSVLQ